MSNHFLDELRRLGEQSSDITYSYNSTWSSNYTTSNLVGTGRVLGNLLSKAGVSLEKGLANFAYRARIGDRAKALNTLEEHGVYDMFLNDDPTKHLKACEILLIGAGVYDARHQAIVFEKIVRYFVWFPSKVHSAFQKLFKSRNEISDLTTSFWKRSGVDYNAVWYFWYKMASRCLSSCSNSVTMEATRLEVGVAELQCLDFSCFEELILSCRDIFDHLLCNWFISQYWNGKGLEECVSRRRFDDAALLAFATGLIAPWEFCFHQNEQHFGIREFLFTDTSTKFIGAMWKSLQFAREDRKVLQRLAEDNAQMAVWENVYKLHHLQRPQKLVRVICDHLIFRGKTLA
ncbi:hypothetical protein SCHPADRAFT_944610 [Schizopora paradoxa]|uniref:Uncharacterized protein n=1 Tax=Schizopora paradoxa TaxID=27342 RepID=A0A0H2RTT6_9AGAM|nr:hypothetical protein SCHPADRAFT_944610 [Schizopora paradoxa]